MKFRVKCPELAHHTVPLIDILQDDTRLENRKILELILIPIATFTDI